MDTMKAVRIHQFGGPDVLKYEDAAKPEAGPGEVLVQVYAVGVNPIDWKIREGIRKNAHFPLILGWDLAGVVEAVGADVTKFKTGDEVFGLADRSRDGAYAEYISVPETEVVAKPKSIDFVHAAAVPMVSLVAWQSLFDIADLSAGQTVLIQGAAGGIGHVAVQLAKWKGARVIGTANSDDVDFVRQLGADEVIDYKKERFEDVVHDVDVVLDVIGGETQRRSIEVLKKGGILVSTVGVQFSDLAAERGVRAEAMVTQMDASELSQIGDLIDQGKLKVVVDVVLPLSDAAKAHEMLKSGQIKGKVVLRVQG